MVLQSSWHYTAVLIFRVQFLLCFVSLSCLYSQSAVISCGGQAFSGSGKVDYTIGQVSYTNFTSGSVKITEGVQQPYEILISAIENSADFELPVVFPNPANDKIIISFKNISQAMYFELTDITGQICVRGEMNAPSTELSLNELYGNIFFLKVFINNKSFTTYKLIKINK
jgi:hypothetical protein